MLIKTRNLIRLLLVFTIFAGVFAQQTSSIQKTKLSENPNNFEYVFDYFDDYIPYRSDVHDQFSLKLVKEILLEDKSNVVFSPFSVKLILALLLEAAGNNTQTQFELQHTLTDIKSIENLRSFYKKNLASLKKENPFYTLNLETKLYTDELVEPQQKFAAVLQSNYNTDIERLKFSDPKNSAEVINAWCKNVTDGRLQQVVDIENIKNSILLLINAMYFKGLWKVPFNKTYEGVFFKTSNEQLKVEYMEITDNFYFNDSESLDAKILRLPYIGNKFSMFILLPKTKFGIDELLRSLDSKQLKSHQWTMEKTKLKVKLPKFQFEFKKSFKEILAQLGISEIFTDRASLPGLARGEHVAGKLKVSNIFQKAGIDVNEKGTEAYASTVVEIENKFGGNTIIEEFNANRPFLFLIEEEITGNIIFAGKVQIPTTFSY